MQTEFDFSNNYHVENNKESQQNFNRNIDHLNNQCKIVYEALLRGERLTTTTALLKYGIGHLPRRIKDLIDNYKIPIQSEFTKDRYKEYFLT